MSDTRTFLRPGTDPLTGELYQVVLPFHGRNINPDGELLEVDAYLSRRILKGELVADAAPTEVPAKPTTSTQAGE